jgi:dephospho-CoA kinase
LGSEVLAPPVLLGLTGGIGSGKSTVAQMLAARGAGVIDADAISRACTASGGAAIAAIRAQFGADFIDSDGALQRARMRQQVFDDPQAKTRLEAIIHPLVAEQIAEQSRAFVTAGKRCIVFDIPLLVESGHWRKRLQRILVVDCSTATQSQRVQTRNALSAQAVEKIMAVQASRAQRLRAADSVLFNDGITLAALALGVDKIAAQFGL